MGNQAINQCHTVADPFVSTRHPRLVNKQVSSLFQENVRAWDEDLVRDMFNQRDGDLILGIPLSFSATSDFWTWKVEASGCFSVKNAYYMLQDQKDDRVGEHNSGFWKKLWQLKIPPKIKIHVWRAVNGCLPTRVQLRQKNVDVSHACQMCGTNSETISHILVSCAFATSCWFSAGLSSGVNIPVSFGSWLASLFENNNDDMAGKAAVVCWAIWKARNELIWNQKTLSVEEVKVLSSVTLVEWRKAQNKENLPFAGLDSIADGAEVWSKPATNTIKINVDAALFEKEGMYGVSAVARSDTGALIQAVRSELKLNCIFGLLIQDCQCLLSLLKKYQFSFC